MSGRRLFFKWRQFEPEIIVCAIRWYLRYSLRIATFRNSWPSGVSRWIIPQYMVMGPALRAELELRQRRYLKPTNRSWRVDETYIRVKGEWCYLYRAVDSQGATVNFFLSAFRDRESYFDGHCGTVLLNRASSTLTWLRRTPQPSPV